MRIFHIVLEAIWLLLGVFCLVWAWRIHPQLPAQSWVFFGMGVFALFMGFFRIRTRKRREKMAARRDKHN